MDWLDSMKQMQVQKLLDTNVYTEQYGLQLSAKDTELLLQERTAALKDARRVEFGEGIITEIIRVFCDSQYITQDDYVEYLIRLQEIFYLYKNEMEDEITDAELLNFMKEQFETVCCGDLDYLETTCLEVFSQAVRAGYREYRKTDGKYVYAHLDEVKRWDRELYLEVLKELCWR